MKIDDLTAISCKDRWEIRKKSIPKYITNSKNYCLRVSRDLFLLGWFELSIIKCAIEIEKELRILKYCLGDGIKKEQHYSTIHYTTLIQLLTWAKGKKILSENTYNKAKKIYDKRNIIAHSLDPITTSELSPAEDGGRMIYFTPTIQKLCDLDNEKTVTMGLVKNKNKKRYEIQISLNEPLEKSSINTIKDTFKILKDIRKFANENQIDIYVSEV